jgi:hypothetical protein
MYCTLAFASLCLSPVDFVMHVITVFMLRAFRAELTDSDGKSPAMKSTFCLAARALRPNFSMVRFALNEFRRMGNAGSGQAPAG